MIATRERTDTIPKAMISRPCSLCRKVFEAEYVSSYELGPEENARNLSDAEVGLDWAISNCTHPGMKPKGEETMGSSAPKEDRLILDVQDLKEGQGFISGNSVVTIRDVVMARGGKKVARVTLGIRRIEGPLLDEDEVDCDQD